MRILVAYGSTRGGTAGLAHMIADAFTRHHVHTDVRRAADVKDLAEYDAAVIGGALYNGRWHPEAVGFVGRHRTQLRALPVWFFSSGPLDDSARGGALAPVRQVTALARDVEIRGHMTFGGFLEKRPTGVMGWFTWGPEGDFRDRDHVGEWVERIAHELTHEPQPAMRVVDGAGWRTVHGQRPPVVIAPPRSDADAGGPDDEEPDIDLAAIEPMRDDLGQLPAGGLARLRRYLTLDEEDAEDDGLDLLESAEL